MGLADLARPASADALRAHIPQLVERLAIAVAQRARLDADLQAARVSHEREIELLHAQLEETDALDGS